MPDHFNYKQQVVQLHEEIRVLREQLRRANLLIEFLGTRAKVKSYKPNTGAVKRA